MVQGIQRNFVFFSLNSSVRLGFVHILALLLMDLVSQDDDSEGIQVSNEMANRMSLFYAYPTPLLKILSDATSKFVTEV